jgi:hypothetical protein
VICGILNALFAPVSLREFKDRSGRDWRVWDVTPENIHPAPRAEDYLREYLEGWLAFESFDGDAKCRLFPIPQKWNTASDEELERWLHIAQPVRGDRMSGPHGRTAAEDMAKVEAVTIRPRGVGRTFRYPGGRYWSVAEWTSVYGGGYSDAIERTVLRFTSGARSLDLTAWPKDWASAPDEQLIALLSRSFPRPEGQRNPTDHRRRAADAQAP